MEEPPSDLLEVTQTLLSRDRSPVVSLYNKCRAAYGNDAPSYHWIRKMKGKQIKNPGVSRVTKLHKVLTHAG